MSSLLLGLDGLDIGLVIILGLSLYIGYKRGLIWVALSLAGFYLGLLVSSLVTPWISDKLGLSSNDTATAALIIFFIFLVLIYALVAGIGYRLHLVVRQTIFSGGDKWLGAVVGCLGVVIVIWMMGQIFASTPYPFLNQQVQDSKILQRINDIAPSRLAFLTNIITTLGEQNISTPFGNFGTQLQSPLPIPTNSVVNTSDIQKAKASVVVVLATGCDGRTALASSGFVIAPNEIMVSAHSISGANQVMIKTNQGILASTVTLFDPKLDVAFVQVPNLGLPALAYSHLTAERNVLGAVLGYSNGLNQGLIVSPMIVRGTELAQGKDIYQQNTASKEVTVIETGISAGDTGAPVINQKGLVLAVIFYGNSDHTEAYATATSSLLNDIQKAQSSSKAVSLGKCVS